MITLLQKNVPLKVLKSRRNIWICSPNGIVFCLSLSLLSFYLYVGKQIPSLSAAGTTALTPSVGNVAAPDLSIFDAYAPPSVPAQNQVMHSPNEGMGILNSYWYYIKCFKCT